jgi:hypothetical protein
LSRRQWPGGTGTRRIAAVKGPPISIRCECGAAREVPYGERWTCEACGRTWDTGQIPPDEYAALLRPVRRYRLLVLGPPLALSAVLIPLAVLVDVRFAFLLFVLVMGFALLVVPLLRRRASDRVRGSTPRWALRPE